MGLVYAAVRAMIEIHAGPQLMTAMPFLQCELVHGEQLNLIGRPLPRVKEVAAPALRTDQHVFRALAVGIAVEKGVSKYGAQEGPGAELIGVGSPDGHSSLAVIGRGRLRHQRTDVSELPAVRETVHTYRQEVPRRKHRLEVGQRVEALRLGFVIRPSQATNRLFSHLIGKGFGKVEFVLQEGSPEKQARRCVRNAHDVTFLAANSGNKVHHAELPSVDGGALVSMVVRPPEKPPYSAL